MNEATNHQPCPRSELVSDRSLLPTSFPYLRVAHDYDVNYGLVIRFAEWLDAHDPDVRYMSPWQWETYFAHCRERDRRVLKAFS